MVEWLFLIIFFIIVVSACCSSSDSSTSQKSTGNTPRRTYNNNYTEASYCECPSCGSPYYDGYCEECGYPDINQGWIGENY